MGTVNFPILRHGILEPDKTTEINQVLAQVKAYVDHKVKNAPLSEVAQSGVNTLVNGLVSPLIGNAQNNSNLETIGTSGEPITVAQVPDLPASKITSGTISNSRLDPQQIRSDLTVVGGPVVANRSISITDNAGHTQVVPIV